MPAHGSLKPIQRAPVPEKLNVTEPVRVSFALLPLWFAYPLSYQSPVYCAAALSCSTRVQVAVPPAGFTVNVAVVVCMREPADPLIVNVKLPVCAVPVVVTVSADEPEPLMLGGLKLPLAPDPKPLALKDTDRKSVV